MKWFWKLLITLLIIVALVQFVIIVYLIMALRVAETRENALMEQVFLNQEIKQRVAYLCEIHRRVSETCQNTLFYMMQRLNLMEGNHPLILEHAELCDSIGGP